MRKLRLRKLAEHLESGKLGHEIFDFSQYNDSSTNKCGTSGCAIGELPILFPTLWEFNNYGFPILKANSGTDFADRVAIQDASDFFGIGLSACDHLFLPNEQCPQRFGGKHLDVNATPEDVAANIRAFLETEGV